MIPCSEEEYYYKLDNMVLGSSQYLRQFFKSRYKTETGEEWEDDLDFIQKFFEGIGKSSFKQAQRDQRSKLTSTCVHDWDMSLLSVVIQNFGDLQKYEQENLAVRELKKMRNDLSHHGTKKISQTEYTEKLKVFCNSLQFLGMPVTEMNKLIEKAGVTSSLKAFEKVTQLFKEADQFLSNNEMDKAENFYNEAIQMPSLLPANLGTAYEKRANFFLSLVKNILTDMDSITKALSDAERAIELNDNSWMAHYLLAKCHRTKNDLSQAIHHYHRALAISPAQQQVRNDLNSCKVLAGIQYREDHRNPSIMPKTWKERVNDSGNDFEKEMGENWLLYYKEHIEGKLIDGLDHVFLGHRYFWGWGFPPDMQLAVKYFSKAASVKNTEGMYNLALCYHYGYGVDVDVGEAFRIYLEVAKMNGDEELVHRVGIAESQHGLGLLYENGIGVDTDCAEAACWYELAMENGSGNSANNLGILFSEGRGVPRDKTMAEICWEIGLALKDANAVASLVAHYISELEPEKARSRLEIGRQLGNHALLNMPDEEFDLILEQIQKKREEVEDTILEFEKLRKLDWKGLTFMERVSRQLSYLSPNMVKLLKIAQDLNENEIVSGEESGGQLQVFSEEVLFEIEKRANQGSETAKKISKTFEYFFELAEIIESSEENDFSDEEISKILDLVYDCVIGELHALPMGFYMDELTTILKQLFETKCEITGAEDMKVRLCYVALNLFDSVASKSDDGMFAVGILKEAVCRYPNNVAFYDLLSSSLLYMDKVKLALEWIEKGLKISPNNPEFLYSRAFALKNNKETIRESIPAYKKFISLAPYDHRKVPEAFYNISFLYMIEKVEKEKIKIYFDRGLKAEETQIPCYLPYGESTEKLLVSTFLFGLNPREDFEGDFNTSRLDYMQSNIFKRKEYLGNPRRLEIIVDHRLNLRKSKNINKQKFSQRVTVPPKLKQTVAKKMSKVKPISLHQMNPTKDQIYENKIIDLTIMDDPNPCPSSIHLIAEDEHGDMTRLHVYNVDRNKETMANFKPGCRIAIVNPYIRIGQITGHNGIRVDEPKCIVYLEKVENMCRFCGEENSSGKWAKCKRNYCSKECQELDRNLLNYP